MEDVFMAGEFLRIADSYDIGTLEDWYISSTDGSAPVWTEDHLEELLNDFYVIPKDGIPEVEAAEVVHAQWDMYSYDEAVCSHCGYDRGTSFESTNEANKNWYTLPRFCEHCGARMDGHLRELRWKRLPDGDWGAAGGRFTVWQAYDRSHGGDCWKMRDAATAVNEYDIHSGKSLKECKEIAEAIVARELGKPSIEITDDMF